MNKQKHIERLEKELIEFLPKSIRFYELCDAIGEFDDFKLNQIKYMYPDKFIDLYKDMKRMIKNIDSDLEILNCLFDALTRLAEWEEGTNNPEEINKATKDFFD